MSPTARVALTHRLVLATAGWLLGCPQLLDDDFERLTATSDAGEQVCAGGECGAQGGAAGTGGDSTLVAGRGGAGTGGAGGRGGAGAGGTTGSAGAGGAAGVGGASAGGASGSSGAGGSSSSPDCWTITLNDTTHSDAGNCLGIEGWNDIAVDTTAPPTVVALSYQNGQVCFDGTITANEWGAVYNFLFAPGDGESSWNAAAEGVGGFELGISGPLPPPRIDFKYTVQGLGDWCRVIDPVTTLEIPFASTHPGCQATGSAPDPTKLTHIRLVMHPAPSAYDIDFCVQLRAIP